MNEKRIVWEWATGEIEISTPAPNFRKPGESEVDWLNRVEQINRAKVPRLQNAMRLPDRTDADLPGTGKRFRQAWRNDGTGKIGVDLPLARAQRMAETRAER